MFIQYDKLNAKNCVVKGVRFVKSVTRRPKAADVALMNTDLILEVRLHTFDARRQKRWWDNEESFETKVTCHGYCGASHLTVFIKNDKLFHVTKSGTKEFSNHWLLNRIMKNVFKEQV
jgi:hypothetical protein